MFRGHLQPALDPLEGTVEAVRLSGNAHAICWSLYGLSQATLAVGEIQRAMSAAQEAVDVGDDGKPSHHIAYSALVLGQAHFLTRKPDRGLELRERASGGPDLPLVAESWRAYVLELVTRCRLALGDRDAAERAVALGDASAKTPGLPLPRAWADRAAAGVAFDASDFAAAADLALRSAEIADSAGTPIEAALSRTLAGRALAAAGDRDRAKSELERAAAALDAETHIRNIFAKLGADSRVEVARIVERADRLSGART